MNRHKTVLLGEAIDLLNIKRGGVVVDATLGSGGHTIQLAKKVGPEGKVISIDLDKKAIEDFKEKTENLTELRERIILVHDNFKNISGILNNSKVDKVDGILADLGWRTEQIEDEDYGMSFRKEAKLDMRFDKEKNKLTAFEIVNEWSQRDLEGIFKKFGQCRNSRQISQEIVEKRKRDPIETTIQLAELVSEVSPKRKRIHPATQVFQALRMTVNDEIENLNIFLKNSLGALNEKGRMGIISFHSLEDRMVKEFFRTNARGCVCPREIPLCVCEKKPELKIITKKPICSGEEELGKNPRSRSAKLRVAEKI